MVDRLAELTLAGYSVFELVASFAVIFILVGVFGGFAVKLLEVAREAALQNELTNLRFSIQLYRILNSANPEELSQVYEIPEYFVLIDRLDIEGKLLDPFGNRYYYDRIRGKVFTTTKKFMNW